MKMSWNRNASSQLCEQYITHVYVQCIYTVCIYGALVRTNNTFELQNDVTLRLFPERSLSKFSGLYASLTVQYMNSKSKLRTIRCFKWLWFTATRQPAILSELLCILGAEGCVVDVDLRFSEAPNSKLRAIICFKWLWFTPTTQQAILSELLCILGATSSGWSSTYSTVYIWYIVHNIYSIQYSIYTQYIHILYVVFPHSSRTFFSPTSSRYSFTVYIQYISTVYIQYTVRLRARWRCSKIGTHHLNFVNSTSVMYTVCIYTVYTVYVQYIRCALGI